MQFVNKLKARGYEFFLLKTHYNLMICHAFRGYTAPEYAIHGQLSEKADTYSYGVVMLEIISGRKSNEIKADSVGEYLLERVYKLLINLVVISLSC